MNTEHPEYRQYSDHARSLAASNAAPVGALHRDPMQWPGLLPDPLDFLRTVARQGARATTRFLRSLRYRSQVAKAYRELAALDDRMLDDIGLERSRIRPVVERTLDRSEDATHAG